MSAGLQGTHSMGTYKDCGEQAVLLEWTPPLTTAQEESQCPGEGTHVGSRSFSFPTGSGLVGCRGSPSRPAVRPDGPRGRGGAVPARGLPLGQPGGCPPPPQRAGPSLLCRVVTAPW